MSNSNFVVEKICRQVLNAYNSKMPLIIIDTDETELANRVAAKCGVVDGVVDLKYKQTMTPDNRFNFYYDNYIKVEEKDLTCCKNFSTDPQALNELIEKGAPAELGAKTIDAKMILLHITPSGSEYIADKETVKLLTDYVHKYVGCFDDNSAIRSSCVILYGDRALLPKHLQGYIENIVPDYPSIEETEGIIKNLYAKFGDKNFEIAEDVIKKLAKELRGFTLTQTEFFVKKMIRLKQENKAPLLCSIEECMQQILESKIQNLMRFGGLLELYVDKKSKEANKENRSDSIGGMSAFIDMAKKFEKTMDRDYCSKHGIEPPKGVLLVGVSGCGKSEAAKLMHHKLNVPMLRLDMGKMMQGLVGASEHNLRMALAQAEAMSPVILFVDEIDKNISGTDSTGDGGTFRRMIGYFLSWMQDKKSPCFIIATANDISLLPKEMFRNDRFDVRFGVFMPTHEEIKSIFAEQMLRAEKIHTDDAKSKGKEAKNLFADDCFEGNNRNSNKPAVNDTVVNYFTHKGGNMNEKRGPEEIKFVTGADIKTIIKETLARFEDAELDEPIKGASWEKKLGEVIDDSKMQTLGSSQADLDAIAACYIRLLRKGFVPVNDYVLFSKEDYEVSRDKNHKITAKIISEKPKNLTKNRITDYDQALFDLLKERIEAMAPQLEEIEYKKDITK